MCGDKYPVLALAPSANDVLFKGKTVIINKKIEKTSSVSDKENSKNSSDNLQYDTELFEVLRVLRRKIATENNIPPFIVFADTSLKQMATFRPITEGAMLEISGVGDVKFQRYGKEFLSAIQNYVSAS